MISHIQQTSGSCYVHVFLPTSSTLHDKTTPSLSTCPICSVFKGLANDPHFTGPLFLASAPWFRTQFLLYLPFIPPSKPNQNVLFLWFHPFKDWYCGTYICTSWKSQCLIQNTHPKTENFKQSHERMLEQFEAKFNSTHNIASNVKKALFILL